MSGKPVILYENLATFESVSYGGAGYVSEIAGFPASNAFSPFTYPADSWMLEAGTLDSAITTTVPKITISLSGDFNAIGLVVNGIPDGDFVSLRLSPVAVPGSIIIVKEIKNGVNLITFDTVDVPPLANEYTIYILGIDAATSDSVPISIPVIFVGLTMEFEKCIRNSFAPLDYNRKTEFLTNESGTGQYIGRSIIRRNHESTVSFDLMTAPWVRSTFQPFVKSARTRPYFFAWNPTTYPNEVNYVWTDEDIGVQYTGDRNRMSASWGMRGLGNDQE